jgi:hypothetical protein
MSAWRRRSYNFSLIMVRDLEIYLNKYVCLLICLVVFNLEPV